MFDSYTSWQDPADGMWLGCWNDYPDFQTEGYSKADLEYMLNDIKAAILDGILTATTPTP